MDNDHSAINGFGPPHQAESLLKTKPRRFRRKLKFCHSMRDGERDADLSSEWKICFQNLMCTICYAE
jgi:hypothetical protein